MKVKRERRGRKKGSRRNNSLSQLIQKVRKHNFLHPVYGGLIVGRWIQKAGRRGQ